MYLSSSDIFHLIDSKYLIIKGTNGYEFSPQEQVGPCSVDIRLANEFRKFKSTQAVIDLLDISTISKMQENLEVFYEKHVLDEGESISIEPNEVVLAYALEYIELPTMVAAILTGRSRFARLGISINCTGDFINPG